MTPLRHDSRQGNFDLLRLIAAFAVLWSHQFVFMGLTEPGVPYAGSLGGLAVFGFFAISGYLNVQSLIRSASLPQFLARRALRIFPGLIVCVLFCVVLGACVTSASLRDYLMPPDRSLFARDAPLSFIWRNSLLLFGLDFNLPGVFETNILPRVINGSLWTLPHEVKLYFYLAIIAVCCAFRTGLMLIIFAIAALAFGLLGLWRPLAPLWLGHHFTTFAIVFAAGIGFWLVERRFGLPTTMIAFGSAAVVLFLSGNIETGVLVSVPALCVAFNAVPLPRWMSPKLDMSYGVYLYAFPIQQLFAMWTQQFWLAVIGSAAATVGLAILSARFVEQPALRLRARLARITMIRRTASSRPDDAGVAAATSNPRL